MLLPIAILLVVVLLAVALLPMKKREPEQLKQASPLPCLLKGRHNQLVKPLFVNNK